MFVPLCLGTGEGLFVHLCRRGDWAGDKRQAARMSVLT